MHQIFMHISMTDHLPHDLSGSMECNALGYFSKSCEALSTTRAEIREWSGRRQLAG